MSELVSMDENQGQEKGLFEILYQYAVLLLKYKKIIFIITSSSAVLIVLFSALSILLPPEKSPLPNYFTSSSTLIVGQDDGSNVSNMLASIGIQGMASGGEINYGELGIRVLVSRPFLDLIVEEHDITARYKIKNEIKTNSRNSILERSVFEYESQTGTLMISYTDIDPVFARDVVDSMTSNLQNWFQDWEGTTSRQELVTMESKIEEVMVEMKILEDEIMSFQKKYGVFSIDQLAETQAAIMTDLQTQLIQTEVALENYSRLSSIEGQEFVQLQAQRDSLRALISQIEAGGGSGVLQSIPSKEELPSMAIEFSHLKVSHEIQLRIYQNLQEQYEIKKLSSFGASIFSILEPAEIPDKKTKPSRSTICMVTVILVFVLCISAIIFIDVIKVPLEKIIGIEKKEDS